jgi:hypothetical protein
VSAEYAKCVHHCHARGDSTSQSKEREALSEQRAALFTARDTQIETKSGIDR